LPTKKVDKTMLGDSGEAECSVCMDSVELGEEVVSLPCQHWFHRNCVTMWLKEHNTCPICRKGLSAPSEGAQEPPGGNSGGSNASSGGGVSRRGWNLFSNPAPNSSSSSGNNNTNNMPTYHNNLQFQPSRSMSGLRRIELTQHRIPLTGGTISIIRSTPYRPEERRHTTRASSGLSVTRTPTHPSRHLSQDGRTISRTHSRSSGSQSPTSHRPRHDSETRREGVRRSPRTDSTGTKRRNSSTHVRRDKERDTSTAVEGSSSGGFRDTIKGLFGRK